MQCTYAILSSMACPVVQYFSPLPYKGHDWRKDFSGNKIFVLIFSTTFSETFLILRRTERDIINLYWSSYKVSIIVVMF